MRRVRTFREADYAAAGSRTARIVQVRDGFCSVREGEQTHTAPIQRDYPGGPEYIVIGPINGPRAVFWPMCTEGEE